MSCYRAKQTERSTDVCPNSKEWQDLQYKSLIKNEMWDLVDLPKDCKAIGSRWVFKVKHHSDGQVERHKCRIIAKSYSQINGAMIKLFHLWYDSA